MFLETNKFEFKKMHNHITTSFGSITQPTFIVRILFTKKKQALFNLIFVNVSNYLNINVSPKNCSPVLVNVVNNISLILKVTNLV